MNLLIQHHDHNTACSFYRSLGPYSAISRYNKDIHITYSHHPQWYEVRSVDCLIMQRPFSAELYMSIKAALDFGVPVIVDFDDDFFNIPSDNPAKHLYPEEALKDIEEILRGVNALFVTTSHLKRSYSKYNKNIYVLPNALDDALIPLKVDHKDTTKKIMWRGSITHERDVAEVADDLVRILNENPKYQLVLMGADPVSWMLSDRVKNKKKLLKLCDPVTFYQIMCQEAPEILIAPLSDNEFNRAKSNIAAIEGTLAGAVVIAPEWEEWRKLDIVTYKNSMRFGDALQRVIGLSDDDRRNINKSAWKDVPKLSKVNIDRVKAIEEVINGRV